MYRWFISLVSLESHLTQRIQDSNSNTIFIRSNIFSPFPILFLRHVFSYQLIWSTRKWSSLFKMVPERWWQRVVYNNQSNYRMNYPITERVIQLKFLQHCFTLLCCWLIIFQEISHWYAIFTKISKICFTNKFRLKKIACYLYLYDRPT